MDRIVVTRSKFVLFFFQVKVCVIFVKYLYILVFRNLVKRLTTAHFILGLCRVKNHSLASQVLWDYCINIFTAPVDCMVFFDFEMNI